MRALSCQSTTHATQYVRSAGRTGTRAAPLHPGTGGAMERDPGRAPGRPGREHRESPAFLPAGSEHHSTVTEQSIALPVPRQCTGHSHYATPFVLSFHLVPCPPTTYNSLALLTTCLLTRQLPQPPPILSPPVCDGPTTPDILFCGAGSPSNDDYPSSLSRLTTTRWYLVIPSTADTLSTIL